MKIQSESIELVSIDSLIPYSKNMNRHTEEQISRLVRLIEYQGFRDPIIVQKGTNIVAAGHGRLKAAKKLGMKEVPVTYQEFENEAQFYSFVASHNAIASWASLDLLKINSDMLDFGPDFDIDMLGINKFNVEPLEKFEIEDEIRDDLNRKFVLEITFPNELELADIRDDLTSRGYIVKEK